MTHIALLPDRGVVEVAGEDRAAFLQGVVSNDVDHVEPGRAVWAALLTPQGKYLADFFVIAFEQRLLLECERAGAPDLARRLSRFRLRAKVAVSDVSHDWHVHAAWGDTAPTLGVVAADPRLATAGWRVLTPEEVPTNADAAAYDAYRLSLGLPDGSRDLEVDKTILLEAGFDELNGVSWTKGCYMGQELTARTRYRGLIKRRLVPVQVEGPLPAPGSPVMRDGVDVGVMRSGRGEAGLATLRIDALAAELSCGQARLTPRLPSWLRLAEPLTA